MIYQIYYKKIIILLVIVLISFGALMWHKEQATNKEIPKSARFVRNDYEGGKFYGEG